MERAPPLRAPTPLASPSSPFPPPSLAPPLAPPHCLSLACCAHGSASPSPAEAAPRSRLIGRLFGRRRRRPPVHRGRQGCTSAPPLPLIPRSRDKARHHCHPSIVHRTERCRLLLMLQVPKSPCACPMLQQLTVRPEQRCASNHCCCDSSPSRPPCHRSTLFKSNMLF
ncbi:hypothetical protein BS78_04G129500 [Paspalum vaginatum]|nr:hypothetical protein BS78_04G129500 [Paspalum vaginatum]